MAAIFKVEKCTAKGCGYKRHEPKPKKNGKNNCRREGCSGETRYSDNWYIRIQHNGRESIQSVAPAKKLAEATLAKTRTEIIEKRFFPDKVPTTSWREAVERFRKHNKAHVSRSTQVFYDDMLRALEPVFGKLTLDKITLKMVEEYRDQRTMAVKNPTVNREIATIKRLFNLSLKWGYLEILKPKNDPRLVERLPEKSRERFLNEDEAKRLLKACREGGLYKDGDKVRTMKPNPHLYIAVLTALETGLRKNGATTLKWADLDLDEHVAVKTVKGGKTVRLRLTTRYVQALRAYRASSPLASMEWVIPSPRKQGAPLSDPKKAFSAALKVAKIDDFRFHDLRHTFATFFLRQTKDIVALSEILGHSDIRITKRVYGHILDEHIEEAIAIFEKGTSYMG